MFSSSPSLNSSTPPLLLLFDDVSPLPPPSSCSPSLERQFERIIEKSLLEKDSSRELRKRNEIRKPSSYDEIEEKRKEKELLLQRKQKKQKRERENQCKRENELIMCLKSKFWEKLRVQGRYEKSTSLVMDVAGFDDALILSNLFGKALEFSLHQPPPPTSPLSHHQKLLVWRELIIVEDQVGDWLVPCLKCTQESHYGEVLLHSGVLGSSPIPLMVSLHHHILTSWASSDVFGKEIQLDSVRFSERFSLDFSFRISCSKNSYEIENED